jgi:hypothetical protein
MKKAIAILTLRKGSKGIPGKSKKNISSSLIPIGFREVIESNLGEACVDLW